MPNKSNIYLHSWVESDIFPNVTAHQIPYHPPPPLHKFTIEEPGVKATVPPYLQYSSVISHTPEEVDDCPRWKESLVLLPLERLAEKSHQTGGRDNRHFT